MFKTSHRRFFIVSLALCAFTGSAILTSANHSWGNYHWARTSNPFTIKLGDNVSGDWDGYLSAAAGDWSQGSNVLNTQVVAGGTSPKNCRPTAGRVEVCNSRYGNNGWLGIAQIWASGSHITQGVVKVNDYYYSTARYDTPAWRLMVMSQEIGHTFGLDHQDENFNNVNLGTCMDYTNNPAGGVYNGFNYGPANTEPNSHDYNQLATIYNHSDNTTTIGQSAADMPAAMNDAEFDGPRQWGRLVRSTNDGHTELYELDFGNGHKIFTFVTWAGEARGRR